VSLEDHIAQAICDQFWRVCDQDDPSNLPRKQTWATSTPLQREVFRLCAEAAIKAGREYREMQGRAAA
jgi:hypothetical protein